MNNLLVIGSVAFDTIKTPFGKAKRALGGSASYFGLTANKFTRPAIVAVVGEDFSAADRKILSANKIDLSGLQTAPGKTFAWGGEYSFDLNSRATIFTHLNVFENFQPQLSATHRQADYVFLGNIHPLLQLDVLSQISKPKFAGLDTMNYWIEKVPKDLKKVLKKIDIFVINDSEARELSGEHNLVKAAKKIMRMMGTTSSRPSPHKGRGQTTLIIKRGEYGLLMFESNKIFHLPGYPLEHVIDPTGAGDSFAGGLFGYLSKTGDVSWPNLKRACVAGSVMASFCVEKLGTKRLVEISQADINSRFEDFRSLIQFDI